MKTFNDFLNRKALNYQIEETARAFAESDIDPQLFIEGWMIENYPEVAARLIEEGIWDGVKQGANQMWQGAKAAGQAFARNSSGPQVKFSSAVKTLNDLVQYMNNDPQLKPWVGSQQGSTFVNQIGGIINQLNQMSKSVPQNQPQTATNNWGNPQQQNQGNNASQRMIQGMSKSAPTQQSPMIQGMSQFGGGNP